MVELSSAALQALRKRFGSVCGLSQSGLTMVHLDVAQLALIIFQVVDSRGFETVHTDRVFALVDEAVRLDSLEADSTG